MEPARLRTLAKPSDDLYWFSWQHIDQHIEVTTSRSVTKLRTVEEAFVIIQNGTVFLGFSTHVKTTKGIPIPTRPP
jgi:hypothetical protein